MLISNKQIYIAFVFYFFVFPRSGGREGAGGGYLLFFLAAHDSRASYQNNHEFGQRGGNTHARLSAPVCYIKGCVITENNALSDSSTKTDGQVSLRQFKN